MMSRGRDLARLAILALSVLAVGAEGRAGYVVQGPFYDPVPYGFLPGPANVSGKEYTDHPDKSVDNANGVMVPTPLQDLAWDGAGGVENSFNYSGSFRNVSGTPIPDPGNEIDALSNIQDALFHAVAYQNAAHLLVSVTGDVQAPVNYALWGGPLPTPTGIWATSAQVNALDLIDPTALTDLDALEVYGPELADDANRFSLEGDPLGVAIWEYNSGSHESIPIVTTAQIAAAIGEPNLDIDLDALMTYGDELLFSIRPIGPFDGGEIWTWTVGGGPAQFLRHGGRLWDTALDVTALFGAENIDALEAVSAVPEPSTVVASLLGALTLGAYCVRRRVSTR